MRQKSWKYLKQAKVLLGEIMIKTYIREQKDSSGQDILLTLLAHGSLLLTMAKLKRLKQEGGLKVADIGCGHGISTILMAKAYPNSKFYGFDNHSVSIEHARNKAREEGLGEERIEFEISSSTNFPFPTEGTDGSSNNEDKQKK